MSHYPTGPQATAEDSLRVIARAAESLGTLLAEDPKILDKATAMQRVCSTSADPAAVEACGTCPWRTDNQLGETDAWLSDASLAEYWEGIRNGTVFLCHKTCVIPEMMTPEQEALGWTPTSESTRKRECAGALAQLLKEEQLLHELGSYAAYAALRGPFGVTPQGFLALASRRERHAEPPVRPVRGLEQYERAWLPTPQGGDTQPIVPPCACAVCQNHEQAHPGVALAVPGSEETVIVDRGIAPIVERLWQRGALTVASCENLTQAVEMLWPIRLPRLLRNAEPSTFNYQHVARHRLAYIRGKQGPAWDPLVAAVCELDLGQVMSWGPAIQVAFPLTDVDRLLGAM